MTFGPDFWISMAVGMIVGSVSLWYIDRLITKWFASQRKKDE